MRIDILTLFPEMFEAFCSTSIIGRACDKGLVEIHRTNIRDFATDSYRTVDDSPYGGGPGMVMICQTVFDAVESVRGETGSKGKVIMLTPQGEPLTQAMARELSVEGHLVLLAGHYEGFDERIRIGLADMEISLGDFVLSGGEVAAMAVCDSVVRLLPGALGKDESIDEESFSAGLLEYPQYTRPRVFGDMEVPEILLSGDHAKIEQWRLEQAERRTRDRRPDLWEAYRQNAETEEDQS
ncbi:MAG: tRNA (guanosine(37)-N1)-methyltransferase TrmD [Planctomycetes bacterium]|nr:tRNA (guanosine(37)-N1)-methyltransferase TrmD [Planctomycetota bacterium]